MAHPSDAIGGLTSPPPTSSPSAPRLKAGASVFKFAPRARVTLKKEDGTEVNLENLSKASPHTTAPAPPSPRHSSPYKNGSLSMPQTPNRPRPTSIRIEFPDRRKARLAEEDRKRQEEAPAKAGTEDQVRKEKEGAGRSAPEKKERALKEKAFGSKTRSSNPFGMGPGHFNTSGSWLGNEEKFARSNKERFSRSMVHHNAKVRVRNFNFPKMVDHNVKVLLNDLTVEKFHSISDQIIHWANKSENEKDGRTLIQVIRLVYEKATTEATSSEVCARLCRKMMERISPKVQDDGIKNKEGKPIAGGQLFRKYLLNRCQEDFERGFVSTASKSAEDEDAVVLNARLRSNEDGKDSDKETDLPNYIDKDYAAQKAKGQGLLLIKFIGELFKLQMLTERIMHECVKKLLANVDHPEDDDIESVCELFATVGRMLDTPKARAHLDMYFSRMKELAKRPNVTPRMQYMLIDLIELRERKWVSRTAGPHPHPDYVPIKTTRGYAHLPHIPILVIILLLLFYYFIAE